MKLSQATKTAIATGALLTTLAVGPAKEAEAQPGWGHPSWNRPHVQSWGPQQSWNNPHWNSWNRPGFHHPMHVRPHVVHVPVPVHQPQPIVIHRHNPAPVQPQVVHRPAPQTQTTNVTVNNNINVRLSNENRNLTMEDFLRAIENNVPRGPQQTGIER